MGFAVAYNSSNKINTVFMVCGFLHAHEILNYYVVSGVDRQGAD